MTPVTEGAALASVPRTTRDRSEDALTGSVARKLKARRVMLGATQETMGAVLGMTGAGYARIEGGRSRITAWQLATLCATLALVSDDVLGLDPDTPAAESLAGGALAGEIGRLVRSFVRLPAADRKEVLRVARILAAAQPPAAESEAA